MSSSAETPLEAAGQAADALTVSVALCTYNGARFIEAQMRSICRQSHAPMEIVLSDDGSTDDGVARAQAVWQLGMDGRGGTPIPLRILRNARPLGVRANFAQAVAACSGDLVALCDQDDVWYDTKLEHIVATFAGAPEVDLVFSDADLIDDDGASRDRRLFDALLVTGDEVEALAQGRACEVFARRNLVTGAACVFRRSLLRVALPFPPGWVHDEWLALVAALVSEVRLLPERTMAYRLHQNNTIGLPLPTLAWRLGTIVQAVFSPVADRQAERARRLSQACADAAGWGGVTDEKLQILQDAATHAAFRATLPRSLPARLPRVRAAWRSGAYRRWSSGRSSALHDLLLGR